MNERLCPIVTAKPLYEASIPATAVDIAASLSTPVDALTELVSNPESQRIALYIPEAWLPTDMTPDYREAYLDAWWALLGQPDQRADFVDGDIGEMTDREPPELVVKAAHLAPMLGRAGLLSEADMACIIYSTDSSVLRESFTDITAPLPQHKQHTLLDYHDELRRIEQVATGSNISSARAAWLYEARTGELVQGVARGTSQQDAERISALDSPLDTRIAIAALTRCARAGADIHCNYPWLVAQLEHDDVLVRRQTTKSLRHLYHGGVLSRDTLRAYGVTTPTIRGNLSDNLPFVPTEVARAQNIVTEMIHHEVLHEALYPVVLLGGSRLKGYGDQDADTDMALITRPGKQLAPEQLAILGGRDALSNIDAHASYDGRLTVDSMWSNMVHGALWIGDEQTITTLQPLLVANTDDACYRQLALRRLEQDTLQYRLMHKGYERHFPVRADDHVILPDRMGSQSVYWDPGYRRLATQLFAERVHLPKQ